MPTTLTYGFVKPAVGDSGLSLFSNLENNITRVDAHTHNGVNSAPLPAQSISSTTATILAAAWVTSGATGHFRQQVTLPAGFVYDNVQIAFRTAAGSIIYPTVEKVSATQYYVYTNDNTIPFTAVYGG